MPQTDARPIARLHIPSPALGACLMAGVERDTRGCVLGDLERFNFYPATPLASISWIFSGTLHLLETADCQPNAGSSAPLGPALPRLVFSGPQRQPTASWSPGPVHALTVGIYPEAMSRLLGQTIAPWLDRTVALAEVAPSALLARCTSLLTDPRPSFERLESELQTLWAQPAASSPAPYLGDWVRSLATRAAHSGTGRSLRQWQRRVRDWTGQSQRDLQIFVRLEDAFVRRLETTMPDSRNLAAIAADAGFADQSHMGREVRRITGHSPARFSERLVRDEAFWYYRLIGDAFGEIVSGKMSV